jgi:hypothetical protein
MPKMFKIDCNKNNLNNPQNDTCEVDLNLVFLVSLSFLF